jgi:hypothetical protein
LLTNLLLPKLTASAPARVVTVTSDAHSAARLDLGDPNLEHGWESWRSYANSKLANILFTRELARRLDGTGVTANCAHPGVVRTGFGRESRPLLKLGITIARPFMASPERGADTIVYLASSPDVAGQTGGYYVKRQRREPSAAARDDTAARELWELSEKMTGLAPARPAGSLPGHRCDYFVPLQTATSECTGTADMGGLTIDFGGPLARPEGLLRFSHTASENCGGAAQARPVSQWLPRSIVRILTTACGSSWGPSVADGLN